MNIIINASVLAPMISFPDINMYSATRVESVMII